LEIEENVQKVACHCGLDPQSVKLMEEIPGQARNDRYTFEIMLNLMQAQYDSSI